jgi:hypothetical protein
MKTLKILAFCLVGFLYAQTSSAQVAVLANADFCPTDVNIDWECGCNNFVSSNYTVPPQTNITVASPCPGGYVANIEVIYSTPFAVQHFYGTCGTLNPGASLPAIGCSGSATSVDLNWVNFGGTLIFYVDINF